MLLTSTNFFFFKSESSRVSTNQINWTFSVQFSKILTHYRKCFLLHPVIPLILVACEIYFYHNFHLKGPFQRYVTRGEFPSEILKLLLINSSRWFEKSSIFASTDFWNNIKYMFFFYFSIQCIFLEILGRFDLFVTPCILFKHPS